MTGVILCRFGEDLSLLSASFDNLKRRHGLERGSPDLGDSSFIILDVYICYLLFGHFGRRYGNVGT